MSISLVGDNILIMFPPQILSLMQSYFASLAFTIYIDLCHVSIEGYNLPPRWEEIRYASK